VHKAYDRVRQMTPEQRNELRDRWRKMSPEERRTQIERRRSHRRGP